MIDRTVDALVGLAAFPAEQALTMSLVERELDTADLWERRPQIIEQTAGLSVWRGCETFEDIGGVENVKSFLRAVLRGVDPPRVVVFIDEIEKAFGRRLDRCGNQRVLPESTSSGNHSHAGLTLHRAGVPIRGRADQSTAPDGAGKFISASTPIVYQFQENPPAPRRRVMRDLDGPLTVMPPSKSEV